MKQDDDLKTSCQGPIQLIQVGPAQPHKLMNIRQMFEQMAYREGEMIRELRQRAMQQMVAAEDP